MKLSELRQEVIDRGYDYVKTSRIDEFLRRAYREICAGRKWPFLETVSEGEPPLEFTDLGRIITVEAVDRKVLLQGVTRHWLLSHYPSLEDPGPGIYWYLEDQTLRVFPVDEGTIRVHYFKRPARLAADDEPLIPEEWQYLMVDRAVVDCLKDDDEYEAAGRLRSEVRSGIEEMVTDLMTRNRQNARPIIKTGGVGDYLA